MGQRGAAAARGFSWPAVGARMEQVYAEVLAARRRAGAPAAEAAPA
jgi:hypothetical protein